MPVKNKCPSCNGKGKVNKSIGGRVVTDDKGKIIRVVDRQIEIQLCNRCGGKGKL